MTARKTLSPSEAATIIGCSVTHVGHLIRTGKLRAIRKIGHSRHGYSYIIAAKEARRYAKTKQPCGWPRGRPRN